jgi:hypothetical protein
MTSWSRVLPEKLWGSQSIEILRILWNPKVHYRIRKRLSPVPFLRQISRVHAPHPTSWSFLIFSHLRVGLRSGLFPSGLSAETLYAPVLSPMRATCPAHLILLGLISRITIQWGAQIIKLLVMYSSPLSSYLSSLRPKYIPQRPIFKHSSPMFLSQRARPSFTPIQNIAQL